jgi:uncharacterized ferredoxin-like protein
MIRELNQRIKAHKCGQEKVEKVQQKQQKQQHIAAPACTLSITAGQCKWGYQW